MAEQELERTKDGGVKKTYTSPIGGNLNDLSGRQRPGCQAES
jgi:hypothetical protein